MFSRLNHAFVENMGTISKENPHIAPDPIDFNDEGKARMALPGAARV